MADNLPRQNIKPPAGGLGLAITGVALGLILAFSMIFLLWSDRENLAAKKAMERTQQQEAIKQYEEQRQAQQAEWQKQRAERSRPANILLTVDAMIDDIYTNLSITDANGKGFGGITTYQKTSADPIETRLDGPAYFIRNGKTYDFSSVSGCQNRNGPDTVNDRFCDIYVANESKVITFRYASRDAGAAIKKTIEPTIEIDASKVCALYYRIPGNGTMGQGSWTDDVAFSGSISSCLEYMRQNTLSKPNCAQPANAEYVSIVLIDKNKHTLYMPQIDMATEWVYGGFCPKQ